MPHQAVPLPPADGELAQLVELVCQGKITSEQRARLNALLAADEQAQLFYVASLDMHATLQWRARGTDDSPEQQPRPPASDGSPPTSEPPTSQPPAPTPEMPQADPSGFFPALWDSLPSVLDGRTPRATFWILFVLVGSLLFGSFGWLVWSSMPDMHVADAPKPPKQVQPEEPEYAVAYLRDQEGAVWADGAEGIPSGGRGFFEGKTAELTSGLAQINFKDGAEVVVEGPCKITFQGRNAARLEQGKLAATVEMSSAKGFVIDTPFGKVTDLGTEFGVEVTEETIDVGVYRGEVSMAVAGSGEVVRLTAGQTARADRQGNVTSGSGQPDRLAIVREIRKPAAPVEEVAGADADTFRFQEGVAPNERYSHDAVYIRRNSPDTNQDKDLNQELIVGFAKDNEELRSLLEFDVSAIPPSSEIKSVSLILQSGGGLGGAITVNVYEYNHDIDESKATWNDPGSGDGKAGGTLGTLLTSATFDPIAPREVVFRDSPAFRAAVAEARAGDGFVRLVLARADDSGAGRHRFARFRDEDVVMPSFRPELRVRCDRGQSSDAGENAGDSAEEVGRP